MGLNMSNIHDTRKESRRELERRLEAEEQCKGRMKVARDRV